MSRVQEKAQSNNAVVGYFGGTHNSVDGQFIISTGIRPSTNGVPAEASIWVSPPAVSSMMDIVDLIEGMRGLQEPTVIYWTKLKKDLGL
jgi:hypothetical protein